MVDSEKARLDIQLEGSDGVSFTVSFSGPESTLDSIKDLLRIKGAYEQRDNILKLRAICQTEDRKIYYPSDDLALPKARWITVAASASFPRGIPTDLIEEKTELTPSQISAYCTSANNPTSSFLYSERSIIYIVSEGIEWVVRLLEKDGQIEKKADS